jgi:outer membrane protein OmpA-like peptidoglycan-associated protein
MKGITEYFLDRCIYYKFAYSYKPNPMKKILSSISIFFIVLSLVAQKNDIPLKEYFNDAEFFFAQEEYVDALSDYFEVSKRGYENNANINYHIGVCYLNIPGQKGRSIEYLEKAAVNASSKYRESTLNEVSAPLDVYLFLGNAYRIDNQLDTAVARYNYYLRLISDKTKDEKQYVKKQIEACNIAKEFISSPRKVLFTNLGNIINTNNSNYNALISGDGSTMLFMTKLPFYDGVFMSRKRGNNWSRPLNVTPQLMSDGDQIVTGISYDGKTMLLAKADAFDSDIFISYFNDGQWTKSKSIGKNINTKYWESHASFSADGKTIYFTSNRRDGIGEMDIYKTELNEKGDWGTPKNLGIGVNTPLNEDTPFISADGKKLYYSSQGHMNMGGYDYFYSEFVDTAWVNPQNLEYPLSSTDEDLFYYPIRDGETALVHKILDDGYGVYDIYKVSYPDEVEIEEAIAEQISADVDDEADQVEYVQEKVTISIEPILFPFNGSTLSMEGKKQVDALIQLMTDNPELLIRIIGHTDALGSEAYNQSLSERRAREVAVYFTSKGIKSERIETLGKGETMPVAQNTYESDKDNPEGRKYNRRVEFEIIGLDTNWFIIKKVSNVPADLRIQQK